MRIKMVILDGYTLNPGDLSWDELGKLGELTLYDRTDPHQIKLLRGRKRPKLS